MIRRVLALMLAGLIALGGTGTATFAAKPASAPGVTIAGPDDCCCPGCGDMGNSGGAACSTPACTGSCPGGPTAPALHDVAPAAIVSVSRLQALPADAVAATRAILPDLPPPR